MKTGQRFLLFVVITISSFGANATTEDNLSQLWKTPSEKRLSLFKKSCNKSNPIDFDGGSVGDLIPVLEKKASVLQIRALIFAEANCTDGASHERLVSALGNEVLLQHPDKLIEAIFTEKATRLGRIVEEENNEWFAVQCEDESCRNQRKSYFASKRNALTKAKVKKEWEAIRQELLRNLQSDK